MQWFIQDFIVTQLLKKVSKDQIVGENVADPVKSEVQYELKSDLVSTEELIFRGLNLMTGYNYLMNIND